LRVGDKNFEPVNQLPKAEFQDPIGVGVPEGGPETDSEPLFLRIEIRSAKAA
jgi:hypothetical protein